MMSYLAESSLVGLFLMSWLEFAEHLLCTWSLVDAIGTKDLEGTIWKSSEYHRVIYDPILCGQILAPDLALFFYRNY